MGHTQRVQRLQHQPPLGVPLLVADAQVAADDAQPRPGRAEAEDGRRQPALVQARRAGQQQGLGALHMGTQRGEDHRAGRRRPARHVHQPGRPREARHRLAPAKKRGASCTQTTSGAQARMTRASAPHIVPQGTDVVAQHPHDGGTVGFGARHRQIR
ncbi:hypothetical protein GCM10020221_27780 [Streptomyces thioluteus]|uniref:Uncharacterized protein n=1 Tax=Streptomyces thioluteus TaxID=66431 RepID=A0ABP6JGS9_STRTU